MAKLYKVRKKCMICGTVFYPKYAGSLYCDACKTRKPESAKPVVAAKPKPAAKAALKPKAAKPAARSRAKARAAKARKPAATKRAASRKPARR